ncbi:MAG: hypothetical protein IKZ13_07970 [Akkermansia sp.]|nr:hypothetical protein [Akkermansia sp.]
MNIPISIKQTNPNSPLQPEETPNFLPLYLTYLRVNHKEPIMKTEIMAGWGILLADNSDIKGCSM